jgi:hypothetical protein
VSIKPAPEDEFDHEEQENEVDHEHTEDSHGESV